MLQWLRYSAFILLYPLGFAGELGTWIVGLPHIKVSGVGPDPPGECASFLCGGIPVIVCSLQPKALLGKVLFAVGWVETCASCSLSCEKIRVGCVGVLSFLCRRVREQPVCGTPATGLAGARLILHVDPPWPAVCFDGDVAVLCSECLNLARHPRAP